jgi:hypothetical protein
MGDIAARGEEVVVTDLIDEKLDKVIDLISGLGEVDDVLGYTLDTVGVLLVATLDDLGVSEALHLKDTEVGLKIAGKTRAHDGLAAPDVVKTKTLLGNLGAVDGAHSLESGGVGEGGEHVEELVVGGNDVDVSNEETLLVGDLGIDKLLDLLGHEGDGIHDTLGANKVPLTLNENSGRSKVEHKLLTLEENGVASVLTRVSTSNNDAVLVLGDSIDGLALTLVSEEGSSDHDNLSVINDWVKDISHILLAVADSSDLSGLVQLRDAIDVLQLLKDLALEITGV